MVNEYNPPKANVDGANRSTGGGLTTDMIDAMRGTKPWVLLIGIVLIISAALMLLGTFGIFLGGAFITANSGADGAALMGIAAMYGLFGFIYILLGVFLVKYSSAIGRLLATNDAMDMEDALHAQRKFWKVSGVLTAVMIVLAILGFLAAIIIPIMQTVK